MSTGTDVRRERLQSEARQASVVVFRSGLTDTRALSAWLLAQGVDHVEVEMAMGSAEERARFHALEAWTGWHHLPQVFINGEFVGGEREFFAHPWVGSMRPAETPPPGLESTLRGLAYGGLIPFVAGLLAVSLLPPLAGLEQARTLLLAYGAVILSFLGAVHWGRLLSAAPPGEARLIAAYAVAPSIAGWLSLFLPFALAAPLQVLLFLLAYAADRDLFGRTRVAGFYLPLRRRLTGGVISLMVASWLVDLLRGA